MIRFLPAVALVFVALPAGAAEVGYPQGALAVQSIVQRDFAAAEARLAAAEASDDPAKLLNLALVYRATGRMPDAQRVYARVLSLPDATDLLLTRDRVVSSHAMARAGLARATLAAR